MTPSNLHVEMRSRIDRFVEELSRLVKNSALESIRAALGETAAPAKRGPGRPRATNVNAPTSRPARKRGGKRTPEEVDKMAERIKTFVHSRPGLGLEAIAKGIGTSTHELKLPVIKLLASRSLSKKGQKRGTKYFPAGRASAAAAPKKKSAPKRRRKAGRKKAKRAARKAPIAKAA